MIHRNCAIGAKPNRYDYNFMAFAVNGTLPNEEVAAAGSNLRKLLNWIRDNAGQSAAALIHWLRIVVETGSIILTTHPTLASPIPVVRRRA